MSGNSLNSQQQCAHHTITNDRDVKAAIREARRMAYLAGFEPSSTFMIGTIAAELTRNMLYHANHGEFIVRRIRSGGRTGIEIKALDHGPGIADIEVAMRDNFSTRGTLGIGLPAVKRLSDEMDIESEPGRGTTVKARKWL